MNPDALTGLYIRIAQALEVYAACLAKLEAEQRRQGDQIAQLVRCVGNLRGAELADREVAQ